MKLHRDFRWQIRCPCGDQRHAMDAFGAAFGRNRTASRLHQCRIEGPVPATKSGIGDHRIAHARQRSGVAVSSRSSEAKRANASRPSQPGTVDRNSAAVDTIANVEDRRREARAKMRESLAARDCPLRGKFDGRRPGPAHARMPARLPEHCCAARRRTRRDARQSRAPILHRTGDARRSCSAPRPGRSFANRSTAAT